MLSVRKAAPARMSAIMQNRRVPPKRLSLKLCQVREPCAALTTSAPTTPTAAASVGVAMPP